MTDDESPIDDFDPQAARKQASGLYQAPREFNFIKRGDQIDLTRKDPTLKNIMIGIGWDLKQFDRDPPDLDASVFLLDKSDRTREDTDFIFYGNLTGCEGAVRHTGDSRTGAGEGDDETVLFDLPAIPFDVLKISFVLSIYDLDMTENNFSHVKNVYFRVVNKETEQEMMRYELSDELNSQHTGLIIGELERVGANWVFRAVGEPVQGGLPKIATNYGIVVAQLIST
jgi:tellurium resistance protein TerD